MDFFVDSSALVKRYVQETGSVWVSQLVAPEAGNVIYIARITTVEVIAALMRRARGGALSIVDARSACLLFRDDLLYDYEIVEMTETLLRRAMILAETYNLRGYEATQLAVACEINDLHISHRLLPLPMVSSDRELNVAVMGEGLSVDDPNGGPMREK